MATLFAVSALLIRGIFQWHTCRRGRHHVVLIFIAKSLATRLVIGTSIAGRHTGS
jgi:hypothetical protein